MQCRRIHFDASTLLAAALVLLVSSTLLWAKDGRITFAGRLQKNYSANSVPVLLRGDVADRYQALDRFIIFPGTDLIGNFVMTNRTDDTVKLASQNDSIIGFLHLEYRPDKDTMTPPRSLEIQLKETANASLPSSKQGLSRANLLPPHTRVELDGLCPWASLSKIPPGVIDCWWRFDNGNVAQGDTTIALSRYEGKQKRFEIRSSPENQLDSIYYLGQQSRLQYASGNLQQALSICEQILNLDSTDYNALETSSDIFWKMAQFDQGILYARKAISLIEIAIAEIESQGGFVLHQDGMYFIDKLNKRIDLMQQHAPWQKIYLLRP